MYSIWKLSKVYLLPLKNVNRIASSRCCVRLESGPPPACRRKVVFASTQDGAAGKALEAQRCWLFVSLERWIDGTLELAQDQEIETTESTLS
jgi:hypothetical protein